MLKLSPEVMDASIQDQTKVPTTILTRLAQNRNITDTERLRQGDVFVLGADEKTTSADILSGAGGDGKRHPPAVVWQTRGAKDKRPDAKRDVALTEKLMSLDTVVGVHMDGRAVLEKNKFIKMEGVGTKLGHLAADANTSIKKLALDGKQFPYLETAPSLFQVGQRERGDPVAISKRLGFGFTSQCPDMQSGGDLDGWRWPGRSSRSRDRKFQEVKAPNDWARRLGDMSAWCAPTAEATQNDLNEMANTPIGSTNACLMTCGGDGYFTHVDTFNASAAESEHVREMAEARAKVNGLHANDARVFSWAGGLLTAGEKWVAGFYPTKEAIEVLQESKWGTNPYLTALAKGLPPPEVLHGEDNHMPFLTLDLLCLLEEAGVDVWFVRLVAGDSYLLPPRMVHTMSLLFSSLLFSSLLFSSLLFSSLLFSSLSLFFSSLLFSSLLLS
jgi:hypothetical protein